ncbi:hypothetical protein [Escherichia coli]|uniref:hypothetical protein n=1 Tax=Escherichia coli TaxID=562 RepID=UPI0020C7747E|nr:hypothetical protein [Escherichia coli]MCP8728668.1 hypothetical protein [Escherichia coli]
MAFRLWQGDAAIALACALFWFLLLSLLRRYTSYRKGVETLGLGDVFLIAGVAMWSSANSTPWIIGIAATGTMVCMSLFPRSNTGAAIRSVRLSVHHCTFSLFSWCHFSHRRVTPCKKTTIKVLFCLKFWPD